MKPCPLGIETTTSLLAKQFRELRKKARSARKGKAEGVHGMRVASRRIRAIAREREAYIKPKWRSAIRRTAKRITKALGDARELDVCVALLEARKDSFEAKRYGEALKYIESLRESFATTCETCVAEILDEELWQHDADKLTRSPKKGSPCLRSGSSKRMKLRLQEVHDAYETWRASKKDADLHKVRIAFKKFRYTCEAYRSIYGHNLGEAIRDAKAIHMALGDWNDLRMLQKHLRAGGFDDIARNLEDERGVLRDEFETLADDYFHAAALKKQRAQTSKPIAPCCRKS